MMIMTMGNDIMSDDNNDNGKCQCKKNDRYDVKW